MSVKILGTGSFLPEKSVSNDDLSKVMDTSDELDFIQDRDFAAGTFRFEDTTSTMAVKAAEKAFRSCRNQCGRIRSYFSLQHYQEIMQHQVRLVRYRKESELSMQSVWILMQHVQDSFLD